MGDEVRDILKAGPSRVGYVDGFRHVAFIEQSDWIIFCVEARLEGGWRSAETTCRQQSK